MYITQQYELYESGLNHLLTGCLENKKFIISSLGSFNKKLN